MRRAHRGVDRKRWGPTARLAAKTETLNERTVALNVDFGEVAEQATTLTDQQQQTAARVVVVLVILEVLGEVLDALAEDGDLNLCLLYTSPSPRDS